MNELNDILGAALRLPGQIPAELTGLHLFGRFAGA